MKKFAFISGILFLVVYFWVNSLNREDNSFDVAYPQISVSSLTSPEKSEPSPEANRPLESRGSSEEDMTYIIVASFVDLEQAKQVAESYTEKYQTEITVLPPTSGGYYRISYGSYSSSLEAKGVLETLRKTGFPEAWLLASR